MAVGTAIAIGALVTGTVLSVYGTKKAGSAAQKAGEAQAQQFEFNAGVAQLQAEDAIQRGLDEERKFRTSVRGMIGTQRAGFAAQGVSVQDGSAADVQADTAFLGELDARQIRDNAQREAWGYEVQQEDLLYGARVARAGGAAAKSASNWQAAQTIVGTASGLLMSRYGWDRAPKGKW